MNEPRHITLPKRDLATLTNLGEYATERDYSTLITESTIVHDAATGAVVLVYIVPIEENTLLLLDKLRHMDVPLSERMSGITTQWEVFGYNPRNAYRNRYQRAPADLATTQPDADRVLKAFGRVVARSYERYAPDGLYRFHAERARRLVDPAWRIENTPFTQGIVNKDGYLPYHYDRTNFRNVWSGMIAFKQGVTGGYLSVPSYDVGFEIADRSLLLFDGQSLWHGVTPMQVQPDGWRYTVVYYSREGMVRCWRPDREAQRRRR